MITADRLSKTFHVYTKRPGLWGSVRSLVRREQVAKRAVREVSFEVAEGEIVGLIGANGAGKTTLVKMLAGIIHPTAGDARVLGYRPWERDNRFRRQIALIMGQKAQLWWDLPAADCFLLLREIYQVPPAEYRATLDQLVELLEVRPQLEVQIRRLSLGERMKMELIAALLHSPRVVYLDEPTIGLDLSAQRAIRDFILQHREAHRPAMIVTSHYMEDIERLCERILILREGELVYDGSLAQVVARWAPHKVITAKLSVAADRVLTRGELERALRTIAGPGTVVSGDDRRGDLRDTMEVRLEVPRDQVTRAAGALLELLPVADLTIEEEDVGSIIEQIQRSRAGSEPRGPGRASGPHRAPAPSSSGAPVPPP